jgi:ribose-phosphate pyrophosphokinase
MIRIIGVSIIDDDTCGQYDIEYHKVQFPSQEIKVKIKNQETNSLDKIYITARLKDEKDLFELMLVKDALTATIYGKVKYVLDLLYMPYMRQDRVCSIGECFSLRVISTMINSMGFEEVRICDSHSNVTEILINNSININKSVIFNDLLSKKISDAETVVLSPDVGAYKEVNELALTYKAKNPVAIGFKHRNLETGQITGVTIHGNLTNKNVVIIDDICDGGRTFIELAKLAKTKGLYDAKSVELIVTHGLFTKGLDVLKPYIDKIYTTDSYYNGESDNYIEVIKL